MAPTTRRGGSGQVGAKCEDISAGPLSTKPSAGTSRQVKPDMFSEDHFRRLERMYRSAPINRFHSPTINISEGHSLIEFPVQPEFFHSANALHGSIYFKALDDAAFFAVNSLVEEFLVLTVAFQIQLKHPVTEGILHCEGQVVSGRGRSLVGESVLTVGAREVARGSGTFVRSRIKLSEAIGYE